MIHPCKKCGEYPTTSGIAGKKRDYIACDTCADTPIYTTDEEWNAANAPDAAEPLNPCKLCGGNAELSEFGGNIVIHKCWPEYRAFRMSINDWNKFNAPDADEPVAECSVLSDPNIQELIAESSKPIRSHTGVHHILDTQEKVPFATAWHNVTSEIGDRVQLANAKYGPFKNSHECLGVMCEEWQEVVEAIRQDDTRFNAEVLDLVVVGVRWLIQHKEHEK